MIFLFLETSQATRKGDKAGLMFAALCTRFGHVQEGSRRAVDDLVRGVDPGIAPGRQLLAWFGWPPARPQAQELAPVPRSSPLSSTTANLFSSWPSGIFLSSATPALPRAPCALF